MGSVARPCEAKLRYFIHRLLDGPVEAEALEPEQVQCAEAPFSLIGIRDVVDPIAIPPKRPGIGSRRARLCQQNRFLDQFGIVNEGDHVPRRP